MQSHALFWGGCGSGERVGLHTCREGAADEKQMWAHGVSPLQCLGPTLENVSPSLAEGRRARCRGFCGDPSSGPDCPAADPSSPLSSGQKSAFLCIVRPPQPPPTLALSAAALLSPSLPHSGSLSSCHFLTLSLALRRSLTACLCSLALTPSLVLAAAQGRCPCPEPEPAANGLGPLR